MSLWQSFTNINVWNNSEKRFRKSEKSHICQEILAYLIQHPDTKDTLEGIMGWWLLEQKIVHQTTMVKEVLTELIEKGLVLEQQGKNAHSYYQIRLDGYEKIKV